MLQLKGLRFNRLDSFKYRKCCSGSLEVNGTTVQD
jgi:hypothetical protein